MADLARLLAPLKPAEPALLDWVRPRLDASMLTEIAQADYGVDVPLHLSAIEELLRARYLPKELEWHPAEVLALTRWSLAGSARLHLMRLFSCGVLIGVSTSGGGPVNSLTPLVESAIELGPSAVEAAGSYLAWCRLHEPGDWRDDPQSRPLLTLALVVLSAGRVPEVIPGLVDVFTGELSAVLEDEGLLWTPRPIHELLKLTAMAESRRMWKSLASRCLDDGAQLGRLAQVIRGEVDVTTGELSSFLRA